MASKAGFASAAAEAMERAAAPKKPWRYYYVMAFPLSNAPSKEKLAGMLEMTDAIEAREEAYLQRMLDRDAPPPRHVRASPLARYAATALTWLSGLMAVVALAAVVVTYRIQVTSTGEELDPRVPTAAYAVAASVLAHNAAIIVALKMQSTLLLRGCVLVLCLSIGGAVFLLDEIEAVHFSQQQLLTALAQPRSAFSDTQIDLVLNGGETPSLWHRFFIDGPAWFLLWLERHCVSAHGSSHDDDEGEDDEVDKTDFFTPFWKSKARACAQSCLSTHIVAEGILRGVVTGVVVAMATQAVLCMLLVWIDQFDDGDAHSTSSDQHAAIARKHKRRRRQRNSKHKPRGRDSATSSESGGFPLPITFLGTVRVACVALALTGGFLTVTSLTLLSSCSFVGPAESWALVLVAVFGVLQVLVALCTVLLWREQLVKSLLVGGLALESYVASGLTTFSVALSSVSSPGLLGSPRGGDTATLLRDAYDFVFQQTCQPMKHWRLHVCVLGTTGASRGPHGVAHVALGDSPACQDQLAALLHTTTEHALALLSWMMAAQAIVLVWLLLPSVRGPLHSLVTWLCCRSASPDSTETTKNLQQKHEQLTTQRWKHGTLPLTEARQLYLSTVKRNDEPTLQLEAAAFDAAWAKMTRASLHTSAADVLFTHQFEAIARALVLRRLTAQCKLDVSLSVSRDGSRLLARICASDNLLMTTLCQCGATYKLQLADAVDPSEAFWRHSPRDVRGDAKLLDAHTVHQKFKLLQLHGVVSRKEAEIFPTESRARVSARVHALLRIHRARKGEFLRNKYAAFVEYRPQRALQFLYKRYPNRLDTRETAQQRRAAVLRTIDCLRLTRQILDSEFDLDLMQRRGLLQSFAPLHGASRFDTTSRETLLASWLAFWRETPSRADDPQRSTSWLRAQLARASPFRQPLHAVRDYFGESIAFYFAWLASYCQWLVLPTLASVVLLATRTLDTSQLRALAAFCAGDTEETPSAFTLPPSAVAFGLAVVAWATAFAKAWERRSVWYALEWGMEDDDADDAAVVHADRANFRGERRRNPATQQLEVHFPNRRRVPRQLASTLVVVVAGVANLAVCMLLLLAQGVAEPWLGLRLAVGLSGLAVALLMLRNGDTISALAHALSEWENYQSERSFQRAVILKVCALQLFNAHGPLLLVPFLLYQLDATNAPSPLEGWANAFHTRVAPRVGVIVQLQLLLALVFTTRIASHVLQMAHGLLQHSLRTVDPGSSSAAVERELALPSYRGAYEDYTEIVVQLGFVTMFSSVFPLAPLLAFVECALELRLDALDLSLFLQRPSPERASGIGPWAACVRAMLALAACVALALLYFVADNYAQWSAVRRAGAFLASALVAFVAAELLWLVVPPQSRAVQQVRARQAFVVDRYFGDGGGEGGAGEGEDKAAGDRSANMLREAEKRALQTTLTGEEDEEDVEASPAHYQERLTLLRRLNTALRKRDETLEPEAVEATAPLLEEEHDAEASSQDEQEEERAIVGYFVRGEAAPPPQQPPQEAQPHELVQAEPVAETIGAEPVEVVVAEPLPVTATSEPQESASVGQYERTALAGMDAIHAAAMRERFDFAQDAGWQQQQQSTERRGSFSQSLSRRFSLFRKRRASMDDAAPATVAAATQATAPAATPATTAVATTGGRAARLSGTQQKKEKKKKEMIKAPAPRPRETSGTQLPVVQLSGLEAVHEAARRDQFDFSTDPWRESDDATR